MKHQSVLLCAISAFSALQISRTFLNRRDAENAEIAQRISDDMRFL